MKINKQKLNESSIPRHLSLVPFSDIQLAAMQAIAWVESKRFRGIKLAEYPYAKAFFRMLTGKKVITANSISLIQYCDFSDRGVTTRIADYIKAIDRVIETKGNRCHHPLSSDVAYKLFPSVQNLIRQRNEHRLKMNSDRIRKKSEKEDIIKLRKYNSLIGQARNEINFISPENISSWAVLWGRRNINDNMLIDILQGWCNRFPSLYQHRWEIFSETEYWRVLSLIKYIADDFNESTRHLNNYLIPNKLPYYPE